MSQSNRSQIGKRSLTHAFITPKFICSFKQNSCNLELINDEGRTRVKKKTTLHNGRSNLAYKYLHWLQVSEFRVTITNPPIGWLGNAMTQALVHQSQNLRGLLPDCLHKKTRLYRLAVAANHMSHYKFACFPTKPNTGVRSSGVCRHVEKKNLEPNVGQTPSDRDLVEGKTEIIQSNNSSNNKCQH